jgi:hypothetical protein
MFRIFCSLLWCCGVVSAQQSGSPARTFPLSGNRIAGFALAADTLFVWGDDAFAIDLRNGRRQRVAEGRFAEGGCVIDGGLILNSIAPAELLWLRLSDRKRFVVDTGVDTRDVIPADLLGHHGILLIHKRQQVRFYDLPSLMKNGWPETEIYTIYTPSTEGGLVVADVDGDGLPDLLCGNYWMKSPTRFELPWREFAIDTWNEEEGSAMLRLAWSADDAIRVAAQRDMLPARAAWFKRAEDPKQLWEAHELGRLQGVSGTVFIGKDLILSEGNAPGRVLLFRRSRDGFLPGIELIRTNQAVGVATLPSREIVVVEKSQVVLLRMPNFN